MVQSVLQSFPQRSLRLKPGRGRLGGVVTVALGVLVVLGVAALVGFLLAPPLWSDYQVRETAVASRDVRMVSGRCRTRTFLMHDCTLNLRYDAKGRHTEREVHYLFVAPGSGNFTVQARVDHQRPELLTSDLGIDYLWNRIATAVGMAAIGVLIGLGLLAAGRRTLRDAGAAQALSGRNLQPVPAQFVTWGREPSWTVRDEYGNQFTWPVRKSDKPFLIEPTQGLVLALREAPGAPVFPLDQKLRFVDLTEPERQRILAAQAGAMANAPAR